MDPTGSAVTESLHTLRLMEDAVRERFPGSILPHPLAGNPDAPAGFLLRHGDGVTLVGVEVRGEGTGEWSLFATSGLAVAGTDIDAALDWANERNRRLGVGKYYCAHSREAGVAALAYDTWLQGAMFAACFEAQPPDVGQRLGGVLFALVANVIETGAAEAAQAAAAIGGRPFGDDAADLQTLLVIALG